MRNFQVRTFRGVNYILVDAPSRGNYIGSVANYERQPIPMPNFKGTGMALKAILRKNETLNGWKKKNREQVTFSQLFSKEKHTHVTIRRRIAGMISVNTI